MNLMRKAILVGAFLFTLPRGAPCSDTSPQGPPATPAARAEPGNRPASLTGTLNPILFNLESPDTTDAIGLESSIAIDAAGEPHIAYRNVAGTEIRYASKQGSQWIVETILQPKYSYGLSLALDSSGVPYIGYAAQDLFGATVAKLAWRSGGTWIVETIEVASASDVAIAFDPTGVLHAVYFRFGAVFAVKYATRGSSGWSSEIVASNVGAIGAGQFSLAYDPQGQPHIAGLTSESILHAVRAPQGWIVDTQPRVGANETSLVVDDQAIPHLATHASSSGVHYHTLESGVWQVETVDAVDGGYGRNVSLKVDRYGRPIVAYYDAGGAQLKLAWKEGDTWRAQVVEANGVGQGPSLALASGADPRISYLDDSKFDLRFASCVMPPPNRTPTANAGGPYTASVNTAITLDGTGSSDPDGDGLSYEWDLGDGNTGRGAVVMHTYAATGVYDVTLRVGDPSLLFDEDTTTATISDFVEARVFYAYGLDLIFPQILGTWIRMEPASGAFNIQDVLVSSLRLTYDGKAISALCKSGSNFDTNRNGIPEIRACFRNKEIESLFDSVPDGITTVTLTLEADLITGGKARGATTASVVKFGWLHAGSMATVAPNPFNPQAKLSFVVTKPGLTTVQVFDMNGRLVRNLMQREFLGPGLHDVTIDGRNEQGNRLASGVYYYRVQSADGVSKGTVAVLR